MNIQELVVSLIAWIVFQTGLLAPSPPHVVLVPEKRMIELAYGVGSPSDVHLRALYNRDNETIYLRDDWNSDNLRDRSELLHELAHHVQRFNKIPAPCSAALEADAYRLQFQWLREQGVADPYTLTETNDLWIALASRCH